MQDKILTCRDCGEQFTFTVGEQEFYAEKGFTNEPSRCPACRAANKASRGGGGGGGRSREREMYPAVCSQCGKQTEVPFQPRGDRPVYCPDCFAAQRGGDGGGDSFGRRSRGGNDRSGGRSGNSRGGRNSRNDDRW